MTTRQRILTEATSQLLERGYHSFTISSVREALDLSSGSMFHAFGSKAALVAEVYVEGMMLYQRAAMEAVTGQPDPAEAIRALIATHLSWVSDHRHLAEFLFTSQPDEVVDAAAPALLEANTAFFKIIEDLVSEASATGIATDLPVAVGHALIIGPSQEYCRQWTRGNVSDEPRLLTTTYQAAALSALRSTLSPGDCDA